MQCVQPVTIRRDGQIMHVPCGTCNFCLQSKRDDWSFRLKSHLKTVNTAHFITFTYSEQDLPLVSLVVDGRYEMLGSLNKRDPQAFFKRLRQEQYKIIRSLNLDPLEWKISYYLVGEYGTETFRPHYHGIFFNIHPKLKQKIAKIWKLGITHLGDVTDASINYTLEYIMLAPKWPKEIKVNPPFALMSQGLGKRI